MPHPSQRQRCRADAAARREHALLVRAGDAPDRHQTQYFEIGGNRGIYHEGWTAVTKHATPWIAMAELPAFVDDVWELYGPDDWTQANDLSAQMPSKLHELQEVFLDEARKYNVLPLDDRRVERFDASHRWPPATGRAVPDLLRRHGAADRGERHQPRRTSHTRWPPRSMFPKVAHAV